MNWATTIDGVGEVMRVDDFEERLGEARELGVELELHPRRQERESLQQTLDIRVSDLDSAHAEAGSHLGVFLRELLAHFAQVLQLVVVVVGEPRIHLRRSRRRISDFDAARLEVDLGPDQQFERHGLSPQLARDFDAEDVVMV